VEPSRGQLIHDVINAGHSREMGLRTCLHIGNSFSRAPQSTKTHQSQKRPQQANASALISNSAKDQQHTHHQQRDSRSCPCLRYTHCPAGVQNLRVRRVREQPPAPPAEPRSRRHARTALGTLDHGNLFSSHSTPAFHGVIRRTRSASALPPAYPRWLRRSVTCRSQDDDPRVPPPGDAVL